MDARKSLWEAITPQKTGGRARNVRISSGQGAGTYIQLGKEGPKLLMSLWRSRQWFLANTIPLDLKNSSQVGFPHRHLVSAADPTAEPLQKV